MRGGAGVKEGHGGWEEGAEEEETEKKEAKEKEGGEEQASRPEDEETRVQPGSAQSVVPHLQDPRARRSEPSHAQSRTHRLVYSCSLAQWHRDA